MKRKLMGIILMVVGIIILCVLNYGKLKAEMIQKQMKKSILENSVINEKQNEELNISELNIFNEEEQKSDYSEKEEEVESDISNKSKDNNEESKKEKKKIYMKIV